MTTSTLLELVNALRVEMEMIHAGQDRLYRLMTFIIEDHRKALRESRQSLPLKADVTGKESVN